MNDMNEALCSILCKEDRWGYHIFDNRFIEFNEDGTGELWCFLDMVPFILLELRWKSLSSPQSDQVVETTNATWTRSPELLGQLNLEITLTKRLPPAFLYSRDTSGLNERNLLDDAFRPKSFAIRIEKGNFLIPSTVGLEVPNKFKDIYGSRYALRLLFDKSPYPPREEWRKPEWGADGNDYWDHVEFVGRETLELCKKGRAMNDVGRSCVVS